MSHAPSDSLKRLLTSLQSGWDGPPVFVITPPSLTLETERALLRLADLPGSFRLRVSTWTRLAQALLGAAGEAAPEPLPMPVFTALVRAVLRSKEAIMLPLKIPFGARQGIEKKIAESLWDLLEVGEGALPGDVPEAFAGPGGDVLLSLWEETRPHLQRHPVAPQILRRAVAALDRAKGLEGTLFAVLDTGEVGPGEKILLPPLKDAFDTCFLTPEDLFGQGEEVPFGIRAVRDLVAGKTPGEMTEGLTLVEARDPKEEAAFLARSVRELLSSGVPEEEIHLAGPDLDGYAPHLATSFEMVGIPLDLSLSGSPNGAPRRLVSSLLRLADGEAGDGLALVDLLECGLFSDSWDMGLLSLLRSGRFHRRFAVTGMDGKGLPSRALRWAKAWPEKGTLLEHLGHLASFIDEEGIAGRMASLEDSDPEGRAREWEAIFQTFRRASDVLGKWVLGADEAKGTLLDLLARARTGPAVPRRGAIRVSDLEGAVGKVSRHLFLFGLTDRTLPPRISDRGLPFKEGSHSLARFRKEREEAAARLPERLFLIPTQTLTLSTPASGAGGKVQSPALLLHEIRQAFPALRPKPASPVTDPWDLALSRQDLARRLALRGEGDRPQGPGSEVAALLAAGGDALFFPPARGPEENLPPELARAFFQNRFAVTALEQWAACPTKHWSRAMHLEPPAADAMDPAAWGGTVHKVLAGVFEHAKEKGGIAALSPEELEKAMDEGLTEALDSPRAPASMKDPGLMALARTSLLRHLTRTLQYLQAEAAQSEFVFEEAEISFGSKEHHKLPPLRLEMDDGESVTVEGRIDRIDRTRDGRFLRLVDYKSGHRPSDPWSRVASGLDLQLLAYALAARSYGDQKTEAAALVYWPATEGRARVKVPGPKEAEKNQEKLKPRGIYRGTPDVQAALGPGAPKFYSAFFTQKGELQKNGDALADDAFAALDAFTVGLLKKLIGGALNGQVSPDPYRLGREIACTTCSMRPVCRFESPPTRKLQKFNKGSFSDHILDAGGTP